MDTLIPSLRGLAKRLSTRLHENAIALKLIDQAIEHVLTGSDGTATALELELISCALEAKGLLSEAVLLQETSRFLAQGAHGNSRANTGSFQRHKNIHSR